MVSLFRATVPFALSITHPARHSGRSGIAVILSAAKHRSSLFLDNRRFLCHLTVGSSKAHPAIHDDVRSSCHLEVGHTC